ncbi:hypothetical protein [Leptothoe spongobia]|uniref:Lipoprotein n=1 Tax=Leptothoe spongobia TAU-MAC 1115 TaxID=1967444 RepID=A0A947GFG1_9CYAN|nr:hypothetical protein [Leptothoe spongobia]MBT9314335.1 hypothetical protein [Leptothoe spongobia TAU-MAC 1115]
MVFTFKRQGMMGPWKKWLLVAVSACLLLGACDRFGERTKDVINAISVQNLNNGQTRLTNENSDVELTLPNGWVDVQNLRPDADLYVAHEDRTMYVMVLSDPKRSEVGTFSLANNSDQYLSFLDRGLTQEQAEVPTTMTSLNGLNALQYEVRGRVDNLPIVYLHTTVEGNENYYQVVGWTTVEKYGAAKEELQTVIQSFRGT